MAKITLSHYGIDIPITIKKSVLAKKLSFKPCLKTYGGIIIMPKYLSYTEGKNFAKKHLIWLYSFLINNKPIPISELKQISFLGKILQFKKVHSINKNIKISLEDNYLIINCNNNLSMKINKSLKYFLMKEVKKYCINQIEIQTKLLNIKYNKVFIKDTISRWGSCSNLRNISLNWKLAFAQQSIINYVISHEVAHLIYFNHSKNFWNLVEKLHPNYKEAKKWLKEYGHTLHQITFTD